MSAAADSNKRPRPAEAEEPRCRYLRFQNLPHGCTSDELSLLLDPIGKVEDCRVARASGGGMLALVEMSCTREATSAKRRLNDMSLRGFNLAVSFDVSRSETTAQTAFANSCGLRSLIRYSSCSANAVNNFPPAAP